MDSSSQVNHGCFVQPIKPNLDNPCMSCGVCCAHFRVSFYWGEADPALKDSVPIELTAPILHPHRLAMLGTLGLPIRCVALIGEVGMAVSCAIYARRPSPCRELEPWEANGQPGGKCNQARIAHGLPPLK